MEWPKQAIAVRFADAVAGVNMLINGISGAVFR